MERRILDRSSSEYNRVSQKFYKSNKTKDFSLSITQIEKVVNQELLEKFERKKQEYWQKYCMVRVVQVFHGTKNKNILSILKNNLQVEFHGRNIGQRFGAGASFSALAHYASHYCDKSNSQLLLFNVLVSYITEVPEVKNGPVLMKPPYIEDLYPLRYDTTAKNKITMDVIVKFENHTFCPAYLIHFVKTEMSPVSYPRRGRHEGGPASSSDTDSDFESDCDYESSRPIQRRRHVLQDIPSHFDQRNHFYRVHVNPSPPRDSIVDHMCNLVCRSFELISWSLKLGYDCLLFLLAIFICCLLLFFCVFLILMFIHVINELWGYRFI